MSDKDREKKAGRNKDKKNKAMREAVKERGHEARSTRPSTEQPNRAVRK